MSTFIVQALHDNDLTIYGDGRQPRSFCYVDDLVDGLIALMESSTRITGPVNLGNPQEFTIRELAELIIELTGASSRIVHLPAAVDDPQRRKPSIQRACDLLGWQPRIPLREGLRHTIRWFEGSVKDSRVPTALPALDLVDS